ncbi:MAG: hypothetical protein RIQ89_1166 [Bacteroidota bacterium]|jgi:hypothetical protein
MTYFNCHSSFQYFQFSKDLKKFFLLVCSAMAVICTSAQEKLADADNDATIRFKNEMVGGVNLHSGGWGLTFRRGWHMTGYKKHLMVFDLVNMRHPKQFKQANPFYDGSKPFFFGKLNYVFILRGGYGRQGIIYSKAERSGVEVRYHYGIGPSLGIAKPVYLDVIVDEAFNNDTLEFIQTRQYDPLDPDQASPESIYAPGPFLKGLGVSKFYPGAWGRLSLSFEYAAWQRKIAAIETGLIVDYFPKTIPIMAFNKNQPAYINFYISFIWGSKY